MKKRFAILLTLVLLCALFVACGNDDFPPPPEISVVEESGTESETDIKQLPIVNVCIDFPWSNSGVFSQFFQTVPGNGKEFLIMTETVPYEQGAERENALTRIRTEILAGKGPDVFLCSTYSSVLCPEVLFPFPKQTMENRIFLPLDDYIEQAEYMEWDKLLPQVMEAGRNEDGQQLLPLAYQMNLFFVEKEGYTPQFERPATWFEMAESDDPTVRSLVRNGNICDPLEELVDYENDAPALSEEEIYEYFQRRVDIHNESFAGAANLVYPFIYDGVYGVTDTNGSQALSLDSTTGKDYWMLPVYNLNGGVTANIIAFTGINRNTLRPDFSFRVLDCLLEKRNQANSTFYMGMQGLPTHMDLYSEESPLHGRMMSEWNFQQFTQARDEINAAVFDTPLEEAMYGVWNKRDPSEEELRQSVHEQYMKMSMMLGES